MNSIKIRIDLRFIACNVVEDKYNTRSGMELKGKFRFNFIVFQKHAILYLSVNPRHFEVSAVFNTF